MRGQEVTQRPYDLEDTTEHSDLLPLQDEESQLDETVDSYETSQVKTRPTLSKQELTDDTIGQRCRCQTLSAPYSYWELSHILPKTSCRVEKSMQGGGSWWCIRQAVLVFLFRLPAEPLPAVWSSKHICPQQWSKQFIAKIEPPPESMTVVVKQFVKLGLPRYFEPLSKFWITCLWYRRHPSSTLRQQLDDLNK